jgi:hypothetical protein
MDKPLTTMKIRTATLKRHKLLAVLIDATMPDTLDWLVASELARVRAAEPETFDADPTRL